MILDADRNCWNCIHKINCDIAHTIACLPEQGDIRIHVCKKWESNIHTHIFTAIYDHNGIIPPQVSLLCTECGMMVDYKKVI